MYGLHDSGGLPADRSRIDTVDEFDPGDDIGELPQPTQSAPAFFCTHRQLMHQAQATFGADTVARLHRA